jgi:hypothetical protein
MQKPTFNLHPDWGPVRAPPGVVRIFMKKARTDNDMLQISMAKGSGTPDLAVVVRATATGFGAAEPEVAAGTCTLGRYAVTEFSTPTMPYARLWIVGGDGHIFTATHLCDARPSDQEFAVVEAMVLSLKFVEV